MASVRTMGWTAAALALCVGGSALAQPARPEAPWVADLGDGRYQNPVLPGDWSDPDVVRVGEDFYLTASSFANVPGLPILHSKDLVNWTIIGHALKRNVPNDHFRTPRRGGGVWAPAIRHHRGKFMIYYPDPDFGIFLVTATNPAGPWTKPVLVDASKGAIDPAPFWDEHGTGWLAMAWAKSRAGINNRITLKRLNADGTKTVGAGTVIIDADKLGPATTSIGPLPWETLEGPKIYKHGGWYYVFAPAGGVKPGWQGVFRSRSIMGPYEGRNVLDQGRTDINGPHQGGWVRTAAGEDWFLHFQDTDSYGRRVHLQPMSWKDGWPVIGADPDGDGRGEPVLTHRKPRTVPQPVRWPQTDDRFDGRLSLAWQWNSNPGEDWADLRARPGWLRLKSVSGSANLYENGAVLTQKLPAPAFTATTRLEFKPVRVGEQAGLTMFGYDYGWIGLRNGADGVRLVQVTRVGSHEGKAERETENIAAPVGPIHLRLSAVPVTVAVAPPGENGGWPSKAREIHAQVQFSYSTDGKIFTPFGEAFQSRFSRWVGAQMGLFASAPTGTPANIATTVGYADWDSFVVTK
jgi:beta-xylosidase